MNALRNLISKSKIFRNEHKLDKTGVINDSLGQHSVQVGSDFHLILKFCDVSTYDDNLCENIITTGRPRGSMKKYFGYGLIFYLFA